MDLYQRSVRVGLSVLLCSVCIRLSSSDLPQRFWSWLQSPDGAAFLIYAETGRDVRFSPSSEGFVPAFVESPPPFRKEPELPPVPTFSDPELVELTYQCAADADIEALLTQPLQWNLYGEEPTVLILHTHGTESYTKKREVYKETSLWRTLDENYNMLSVGDFLAKLLTDAGIPTVQDRQLHDYPSYNGSYVHARTSIESYLEEYPSIRLILDLHRDASEGTGGQLRTLAHVDGNPAAQLMIVLGTNHKGYEENLSLALKLHAQLESQSPGITRPLQLRGQRFNQDLLPGALLIEVGAAGNSHPEALAAAQQLAQAVIALARGTQ